MAYSMDLRKRVIQALEEGMTQNEVSERFEVSVSAVQDWVKLNREYGSPAKQKRSNESYDKKRGIPDSRLDEFKEYVLSHPELINQEIGDHFGVSDSSIERYLKKVKITRKKRLMAIKSVQKRQERSGKSKSKK
jgi:transposase